MTCATLSFYETVLLSRVGNCKEMQRSRETEREPVKNNGPAECVTRS